MFKRIAAIGFIVVCTSIAWAILGSTIFYRTNYSDEQLKGRVSSAWGTAQEQTPPTAAYQIVSQKQVATTENGTSTVRTVEQKTWVTLPLEQTPRECGAAAGIPQERSALVQHVSGGFFRRLSLQQSQRSGARSDVSDASAGEPGGVRRFNFFRQRRIRWPRPMRK